MTNHERAAALRKLLTRGKRPLFMQTSLYPGRDVEIDAAIAAALDAAQAEARQEKENQGLPGNPAGADAGSLKPVEATVVEPWKPVRIGKKHTYFQCPRCLVARVTEWCPPPCNTQSLAFKRMKETR